MRACFTSTVFVRIQPELEPRSSWSLPHHDSDRTLLCFHRIIQVRATLLVPGLFDCTTLDSARRLIQAALNGSDDIVIRRLLERCGAAQWRLRVQDVGRGTIFQPAPEELWHLAELRRVPPDEVILVVFPLKRATSARPEQPRLAVTSDASADDMESLPIRGHGGPDPKRFRCA